MRFCPKCGKEIGADQEFCELHAPISFDFRKFTMKICGCGRVFSNHWFTTRDFEGTLMKAVREHIKQRVEVEIEDLTLPEKRKGSATLTAKFQGKTQKVIVPLLLERCDKCLRMGTQFYTAILQLRNPPEEALPFIETYLAPLADKGVCINKVEDTPLGPDLYMTHKGSTRQLGEKLVRKYGGRLKLAEELFSRNSQTSKDIFRLNVSVEFPKFTVGNVVIIKGKIVKVTGLGKACTGVNLETGKKVVFIAGDEEKKLRQHKTKIINAHPMQVLDPETYQAMEVKNPGEQKVGEEVTVVKHQHVYIVSKYVTT
jgi:NMD protein affecting ribosome stability and mRNA decay